MAPAMMRPFHATHLVLCAPLLFAACGGDNGSPAGLPADGAVPADGAGPGAPDAGASDAITTDVGAPDMTAADTSQTAPDSGVPAVDMGMPGGVPDSVRAAWAAAFNSYVQLSLPVLVMTAGAAPPATVQVNASQACPKGGKVTVMGPATIAAGRQRTMSNFSVDFEACKYDGLGIEGTWTVMNDTMPTTGGFESYTGDLTFTDFHAGTCATNVTRTITREKPTGVFSGTFCGYDITRF
jgi:hypothetical protein